MKNEQKNTLVESEDVAVALRVLADEYFEGRTEDRGYGFIIRSGKYGNFEISVRRI